MIEREDGAYFGILLHQIIDAHREAAECSRRKWRYAAFAGIASFILASYLSH